MYVKEQCSGTKVESSLHKRDELAKILLFNQISRNSSFFP